MEMEIQRPPIRTQDVQRLAVLALLDEGAKIDRLCRSHGYDFDAIEVSELRDDEAGITTV